MAHRSMEPRPMYLFMLHLFSFAHVYTKHTCPLKLNCTLLYHKPFSMKTPLTSAGDYIQFPDMGHKTYNQSIALKELKHLPVELVSAPARVVDIFAH